MNTLNKSIATAIISAALTGAAATAFAGAADVKSSEGGAMKFEYDGGDNLRINMGNQAGYMVKRGNEMFMVTDADGQMMVVSMNQALGMFAGMAQGATPNTVEGKLLSMKATGRSETVAGIKGEVYQTRFIDDRGQERSEELVLARDQRAVDFQRAMFGMIDAMGAAAGADTSAADEMKKKLKSMNMGVLRYGDEMWVANISDRKIDPARFELPAEPMDLSALGGVLGAASGAEGEEEGGFVSGILGAFGGKKDRQEDRLETTADQTVDRATDSAVDGALTKAFDKHVGK